MSRHSTCLSALLVLCLAGIGPAQATIVKSLSLDDMVQIADVIVHGRVIERKSAWNDAHTRIYTRTQVQVIDPLKGAVTAGQVLTVRQLGGAVEGLIQQIPGNARLHDGEEVVLFLRRDEKKPLHYVVGMAQGKFAVDRSGATPTIGQHLTGLALARVKGRVIEAIEPTSERPRAPTTLQAFKNRVRPAR